MRSNPNVTFLKVSPTHVPVGSQLTVTIGRNVGGDPLSDRGWDDFKSLVSAAVTNHARPALDLGWFTGQGQWNGVTEESAVLIVITGRAVTPANFELGLSMLAEAYGQEAIAWSYGPNHPARS